MSISGTITFGTGGTFATLFDAWDYVLANDPLDGDLTLLQVGNSDNTGADHYGSGIIEMAGFRFTIKGQTPHYGSPLNGHWCKFGGFTFKTRQYGTLVFDDTHFISTAGFSIYPPDSSLVFGVNNIILKNNLWRLSGANSLVGVYCHAMGTYTASAAALNTRWNLYVFNNKIQSERLPLRVAPGGGSDAQNRMSVYVENNVFRTTANGVIGGSITYAGLSIFDVYDPFTYEGRYYSGWLGFSCRNNVYLVHDATTQRGMHFPSLSTDLNAYLANALQNARNQGLDAGSRYAYNGITVPADILNTDPTLASWLDDNHTSNLFTNGATPTIAENPYSSPYPIGIWYPLPPVGIGGDDGSGMRVGLPTAAGQGYMRPGKSRIFPWATGRLSHARIIAAHRSPDQAAQFHNLIREGT